MKASTLQQLTANLVAAQQAMVAELLRQYPIGARVGISIKHGQRNPSPGTVAGAQATGRGGLLRVEMDGIALGARHHWRTVSVDQVMTVYSNGGAA